MTQVTPENIKEFFEQAASAYGDAWKAQADYYEGVVRRNTKALTELADARVESFKEMREAQTFNQAFEANLAFEDKVREGLAALQEENTKSWETLVDELKAIYTPASEAAKTKAPAKKAAEKTKAPAKKAAEKTKAPAKKAA
jgi:gas vesicle protein